MASASSRGRRLLPALRVAHEDLDQVGVGGGRHLQGVVLLDVGTDERGHQTRFPNAGGRFSVRAATPSLKSGDPKLSRIIASASVAASSSDPS